MKKILSICLVGSRTWRNKDCRTGSNSIHLRSRGRILSSWPGYWIPIAHASFLFEGMLLPQSRVQTQDTPTKAMTCGGLRCCLNTQMGRMRPKSRAENALVLESLKGFHAMGVWCGLARPSYQPSWYFRVPRFTHTRSAAEPSHTPWQFFRDSQADSNPTSSCVGVPQHNEPQVVWAEPGPKYVVVDRNHGP